MSRTQKGSKGSGYDYWSRRPYSSRGYGPDIKKATRRVERRQSRKIAYDATKYDQSPDFTFICDKCGTLCLESERGCRRLCKWCHWL